MVLFDETSSVYPRRDRCDGVHLALELLALFAETIELALPTVRISDYLNKSAFILQEMLALFVVNYCFLPTLLCFEGYYSRLSQLQRPDHSRTI